MSRCLDKYKTYEGFIQKLGLEHMFGLIQEWHETMISPKPDRHGLITMPTLRIATLAFGYEPIMAWLMTYIVNVNSFLLGGNTEKKMTPMQMEDASSVILDNYGERLFCSEIPVVFSRIKGGKYGKAYGVIDGGMICNCFQLYLEGRSEEVAAIHKRRERERVKRRNEEWARQKTVNLGEWRNSVEYHEMEMTGQAEVFEDFIKRFDLKIGE